MSKKPNKKQERWVKVLETGSPEQLAEVLEEISKDGDISIVPALLSSMARHDLEPVSRAVSTMLSDVKDKRLGDILFEGLEREELRNIRVNIISIIWNAGISLNGRLETLVRIGGEGGFEEQFEVITALDNYAGEFEEEEVLNSLIDMKEMLRASGEVTELQQQILQKLQILERFD